jgi:DNA invertase Pin-like site-specific DNA recombinase
MTTSAARPNDRLLLGMKGSISEFELGVLRARMLDAARAKARRGENFWKFGPFMRFFMNRPFCLTAEPQPSKTEP